jgi:hypothetical protein
VPRVSRLLAQAHRFAGLIRDGSVKDYAELARLAQVSRARLTQIMNLLLLAPDIQEQSLFRPKTAKGHDPIRVQHLQTVALAADWSEQRGLWRERWAATNLGENLWISL